MKGERDFFRKSFLGGFNRRDVVAYISKLAAERNEIEATRDKAVNDARAMTLEIAALQMELDEARRLAEDYKAEALEAAAKVFAELETLFEVLRIDVERATAGACKELDAVAATVAGVPTIFEQACDRLAEMKSTINTEYTVRS